MAHLFFTLDTLQELDGGRVVEAFNQAIRRAVADCDDRPGEQNARKITLSVALVPVIDDSGACDGVDATFDIRDTIPTRKSKRYSFGMKSDGRLYFSTESPDNVAQADFGFDEAAEA